MLFVLLPLLATAGGGMVLWHTSVGERVLSAILTRVLKKLGDHGTFSALKDGKGIRVDNLSIAHDIGMVLSVTAEMVQLQWPTLSKPMHISLCNVTVHADEKAMPKHLDPQTYFQQVASQQVAMRLSQLKAIDDCLWCPSHRAQGGFLARYLSSWAQWALHSVINLVASLLHIDVQELEVKYRQQGQPGPHGQAEGGDGLCITVRQFLLQRKEESSEASSVGGTSMALVAVNDDSPSSPRSPRKKNATRQLEIVVAGVNVWIESWQGTQYPGGTSPPTAVSAEIGVAGKENNFVDGSANGPSSSNGNPSANDWGVPAANGNAPPVEGGTEALKRRQLLKQWGASMSLTVSDNPLPGPKARQAATPAWDRDSKSAFKKAHSQAHEVMEKGLTEDDVRSDDGDAQSSHTQEEDSGVGKRERMNTGQMLGWVKQIIGVVKPLLAGPGHDSDDKGKRRKKRKGRVYAQLQIELHAAILAIAPADVPPILRIVKRMGLKSNYAKFWQTRPLVSVKANPIAWWHHAGRSVMQELKGRLRVQSGLHRLEDRRRTRQMYTELYSAVFVNHPHWQVSPNANLWQRINNRPMDSVRRAKKDLEILEESLSLEEIAQFRLLTACRHNSVLSTRYASRLGMAQCVGAIASSPVATRMQPILLSFMHGDDYEPISESVLVPDVSITVPKVGLALSNPTIKSSTLASVHNISLVFSKDHELTVGVGRLHLGRALPGLEPDLEAAVIKAPCSMSLSESLERQVSPTATKAASRSQSDFLHVTMRPAEAVNLLRDDETTPDGKRMADLLVPRVYIDATISGIEFDVVEGLLYQILSFVSSIKSHNAEVPDTTNGSGQTLKAAVNEVLVANRQPQLLAPAWPLPVLRVTCLGAVARLPFSAGAPSRAEHYRKGGETTELSFMLPAFHATVMGMQSDNQFFRCSDEQKSRTPVWSPDNEVCVMKFATHLTASFRPRHSNDSILQTVLTKNSWRNPQEEGPTHGKEETSKDGSVIPILMVREFSTHVAFSLRSYPDVKKYGFTSAWGHNSIESALVWLSPYHINELLSLIETLEKRMKALQAVMGSNKPPASQGQATSGDAPPPETQAKGPQPPGQSPVADQSPKASTGSTGLPTGYRTMGITFNVGMVSVMLSAIQDSQGSNHMERAKAMVRKEESLVQLPAVGLIPCIELLVGNLHGICRASGARSISYTSKVDGVLVRNLQHSAEQPSAYLMRPNIFQTEIIVKKCAKLRQEALEGRRSIQATMQRLINTAAHQTYLVQIVSKGYCRPVSSWLDDYYRFVGSRVKMDLTTISASIDATSGSGDKLPTVDVRYGMSNVRMGLSVATLHTIADMTAQCAALHNMHKSVKLRQAKQAPPPPPPPPPPPDEKPPASPSGPIKALKSVEVKTSVAVHGATIELVARDGTRAASVTLRECNLCVAAPGANGTRTCTGAQPEGRQAPGGLLLATFSIADIMIRDTMASDLHSMVLKSTPGSSTCQLQVQFGIHQKAKSNSLYHVVECAILDPQVLVMMRFIKNVLYCVNDVLAGTRAIPSGPSNSDKEESSPPKKAAAKRSADPSDVPPFSVRLRVSGARVILPLSAQTRQAIVLECAAALVGLPGAALLQSELPKHVSAAGGLISDHAALEATNLRGPAGQFQRSGAKGPLVQSIGIRLAGLCINCASVFIPRIGCMDSDVTPVSSPQKAIPVDPTKRDPEHKQTLPLSAQRSLKVFDICPAIHKIKAAHAVLSLAGAGQGGMHLHASTPLLQVNFSHRIYNSIMDFLAGNFAAHNSFEPPPPPPDRPVNTSFRPCPSFAPAASDPSTIRISATVSRAQILLLAPASEWTPAQPLRGMSQVPVAFLRVGLQNVLFNLFMLQSGKLHMDIGTGKCFIDDVRFAPTVDAVKRSASMPHRSQNSGSFSVRSGASGYQRTAFDGWYPSSRRSTGSQPPVAAEDSSDEFPRLPLIEMDKVEVAGAPVFDSREVPVVHILHAPWQMGSSESAHLQDDQEPSKNVLSIRFTMVGDGTMAAEVALSNATAQWPFVNDLSLVFSILSILKRTPPAQTTELQAPKAAPWFYFNFLYNQGQLVLPVIPPISAKEVSLPAHATPAYNNCATLLVHRCCAIAAKEALRSGVPDFHSNWRSSVCSARSLTSSAVVASQACFRLGFFFGGDGEMRALVGLDQCAVFVRHLHACMTGLILPFSADISYSVQKAEAESNRQTVAAIKIQRFWRTMRKQRILRRRLANLSGARESSAAAPTTVGSLARMFSNADEGLAKFLNRVDVEEDEPRKKSSFAMVDELVHRLLDDQAKAALKAAQAKRIQAVIYAPGGQRESSVTLPVMTNVAVKCSAVTLRLAFSNVFVFQELSLLMAKTQQAPSESDSESDSDSDSDSDDGDDEAVAAASRMGTAGSEPKPESVPASQGAVSVFRPVVTSYSLDVTSASVVICNDRPQSYGAPDFVLLTARSLSLMIYSDQTMPSRAPDVMVQLAAESKAEFLNNSSGAWQQFMASWPVEMHVQVAGTTRSSEKYNTKVSINSREQLETTFNPALMLTIGDILTFKADAGRILSARDPPNLVRWYGRGRPQVPVEAPPMQEQLALGKPLTARVPQKYLIQNYTGVSMTYWSGVSDSSSKSLHHLDQGEEESLSIEPTDHTIMALTGKAKALIKYHAKVINIKLQGNWMPVKRIVVSHIGKSSYNVVSPHGGLTVPLVVDVSLVGRTKIICFHSSVKIKNCCDSSFNLRLHMPTMDVAGPAKQPVITRALLESAKSGGLVGFSNMPPAGQSAKPPSTNSQMPKPKSQNLGRFGYGDSLYLPIQAMFEGILYVQAEGFQESSTDAIYLDSDISCIQKQQGYICCKVIPGTEPRDNFHCAVLVKPVKGGAQSKVLGSGVMEDSDAPIECELELQPTLQLQNGLPYPIFILLRELEHGYKPQTGIGRKLRAAHREMVAENRNLQAAYGEPTIKGSYSRDVLLMDIRFKRIVLPPGAIADLHVDMNKNVLALADVPSLRLESDRWALLHQSPLTGRNNPESSEPAYVQTFASEAKEIRMVKQNSKGVQQATAVKTTGCCGCGESAPEANESVLEMHLQEVAELLAITSAKPSELTELSSTTILEEAAHETAVPLVDDTSPTASQEATPAPAPHVSVTLRVQDNSRVTASLSVSAGDEESEPEDPPPSNPVQLSLDVADNGHVTVLIGTRLGTWGAQGLGPPASAPPPTPLTTAPASSEHSLTTDEQRFKTAKHRRPKALTLPSGQALKLRMHSSLTTAGGEFAQPQEQLMEVTADSVLCPPAMFLALHREDRAKRAVRVVTFAVPYWVNNCTGHHLIFSDSRSVPNKIPLQEQFNEILVPFKAAHSMDDSSAFFPSLLNEQAFAKFRFAKSTVMRGSTFTPKFRINTVGQPKGMNLLGVDSVPMHEAPGGLLVFQKAKPTLSASTASGSQARPLETLQLWVPKPTEDDGVRHEPVGQDPGGLHSAVRQAVSTSPKHGSAGLRKGSQLSASKSSIASRKSSRVSNTGSTGSKRDPQRREAQRQLRLLNSRPQFRLNVEVKPGPPDSAFRFSKVIEVRSKYIIENQTGVEMEVKQVAMPDADALDGTLPEPALQRLKLQRTIPHGAAQALVLASGDFTGDICIRPGDGQWHWSGSYTPMEKENYFGMRLLHKTDPKKFLILPVSVSVGKGTVLISLQSAANVPPYRLQNLCTDLKVFFVQDGLQSASESDGDFSGTGGRNREGQLAPECRLDYAFDEPMMPHRLTLSARLPSLGTKPSSLSITIDLDRLGTKRVWQLPTSGSHHYSRKGATMKRKAKLAKLAREHLTRKIYLEVYADGPTRTLRISDTPGHNLEKDISVIVDLATDIRRLDTRLREVNRQFMGTFGTQQGSEGIDLFGRGVDSYGQVLGALAGEDDGATEGGSLLASLNRRSSGTVPESPLASGVRFGSNSKTHYQRAQGFAANSSRSAPSGAGESVASTSKAPPPVRQRSDPSPPQMDERGKAPLIEIEPGPGSNECDDAVSRMTSEMFSGPDATSQTSWGDQDLEPSLAATDSVAVGDEMSFSQAGGPDFNENGSQHLLEVLQTMQDYRHTDLELMVGGELAVTVVEAEGLNGNPQTTNPFAVICVGKERISSSVRFETIEPKWNHQLQLREVVALGSELKVELWDLCGTKDNKKVSKSIKDLAPMLKNVRQMTKNSRFLGQAIISLGTTLSSATQWLTLMRREAGDHVAGRVQLTFSWEITAKGLLLLKQRALHSAISQRTEILSLLNPLSSNAVRSISNYDMQQMEAKKSEPPRARAGSISSVATDDARFADILREAKKVRVDVTVLAAKGLGRSKGLGNIGTVQLQLPQPPDTYVVVSIAGNSSTHSFRTPTVFDSALPFWTSDNEFSFDKISLSAVIHIGVYCKYGWASRPNKIGDILLPVSSIRKLNSPSHAWLELNQSHSSESRMDGEKPEVMVRLSFSDNTKASDSTNLIHDVSLNLKGVGLGLMQDQSSEILNITYNTIQLDLKVSEAQAELKLAVQLMQIDNQLITATKPVILCPNVRNFSSKAKGKSSERRYVAPMIVFKAVRSFQDELLEDDTKEASITSFKEVSLQIGEMDFQADDDFLEALLGFVMSIPFEDLTQDYSTRQKTVIHDLQQRAHATLCSLSRSFVLELNSLQGSGGASSWYFLESLVISRMKVNASVSVTSSLVNSTNRLVNFGEFGKYLGAAGFSLVNVSNVPLQLGGLEISSELLSINNLIGRAFRHYFSQGLREAHKVMGGSGPGLAGIPLTGVWAVGSVYDIGDELFKGELSVWAALQKAGFVCFTAAGQMIGAVGKTALSVMIWTPPYRDDLQSDNTAIARYITRPRNAPEALKRGITEPVKGLVSAGAGVYMDPVAGAHAYGPGGCILGVLKSFMGCCLRPAAGCLEGMSKVGEGIGLLCLGEAGIEGTMATRIRAPGAIQTTEQSSTISYEAMKTREAELQAWQGSLTRLVDKTDNETVLDVVLYKENRIMIITNKRVVMVKSRMMQARKESALMACWNKNQPRSVKTASNEDGMVIKYTLSKAIRFRKVQTVTGNSERLSITIHHAYRLFGTRTMVPTTKTFFCSSREIYNKLIYLIHRQGGKTHRGQPRGLQNAFEMETKEWTMFGTGMDMPEAPERDPLDAGALVGTPAPGSPRGQPVNESFPEITPAMD